MLIWALGCFHPASALLRKVPCRVISDPGCRTKGCYAKHAKVVFVAPINSASVKCTGCSL